MISILVLLVVLGVIAIVMSKGKKREPDYYSWFIMGMIWLVFGIPLKIYALIVMGIAFGVAGLVHYKDWKKSQKINSWKKLSKAEKKLKILILLSLTVILIVGIIVFIITSGV